MRDTKKPVARGFYILPNLFTTGKKAFKGKAFFIGFGQIQYVYHFFCGTCSHSGSFFISHLKILLLY